MNIKWNKYTWYSKLAAIIFFIGILPIWVFYLGMQYQQAMDAKRSMPIVLETSVKNQPAKTYTNVNVSRNNLQNIRKGDKIGPMTVVSVGRLNPKRTDIPLSLNARMVFSGTVTVSGTYHHYGPNEDFTAGEVCFNQLDQTSENKLPKFTDDGGQSFFCFSNKATARATFGPQGSVGQATVTIKNYNLVYMESEVWNTAELVSKL